MKFNVDDSRSQFFPFLIQALLIPLTLGFYMPWAVTEMRRRIWSNIQLNQQRFLYLGQASELLKGYIFLIGLFIAAQGISILIPSITGPQGILPLIGNVIGSTFFFFLVYKSSMGSFKYQINRTLYAGIRPTTDLGPLSSQFVLCAKYAVITALTFGLAFPYLLFRMDVHKYSSLRYGNEAFKLDVSFSDYINLIAKFILSVIGFMIVVFLIIMGIKMVLPDSFISSSENTTKIFAALFGVCYGIPIYLLSEKLALDWLKLKVSHFKSDNLTFETSLTLSQIIKLHMSSVLLLIVSFGLAFPLVKLKNIKVYLSSITVNGIEELEVQAPEESEDLSTTDYAMEGYDLSLFDVF